MAGKTNAMRIMESTGIPFRTLSYDVNDENFDGLLIAQKLSLDPNAVFKTLVLRGDKTGILVCCLPVNAELDLKKVARASGDKHVEMTHVKELLALTGYIRGGCSPVGMKKLFPTFIDETAQLFDEISVSAGQRGLQMLAHPESIAQLVHAKYADLTFE